jgi:hypothetical protein
MYIERISRENGCSYEKVLKVIFVENYVLNNLGWLILR